MRSIPHRRGRILVVEDDQGFLRTVILPVFARHFSVLCAHNVRQAHEALDSEPDVSVALLDLNLPGGEPFDAEAGTGGGLEIARRVRSEFPSVRCAILTAYTTPALVNAAQLCGAEFISKIDCTSNLEALRDSVINQPALV